jgi:undecaprenyl-diphosphatase
MLEEVFFGLVQGIVEWLPISSEGIIAILATNFMDYSLISAVRLSLFLHLGTLLSVLAYFRKDFFEMVRKPLSNLTVFLVVTTIFSGVSGLFSYYFLEKISGDVGFYANVLVSLLLIITAITLQKTRTRGGTIKEPLLKHAVIVGLAQGFSILPGISRSGITIGALLLLNYDSSKALKLSFLMSVPAVLMANVFLAASDFLIFPEYLLGGAVAFITGLLTLDFLLKIVEKLKFWKLCVVIAMLNTFFVFT